MKINELDIKLDFNKILPLLLLIQESSGIEIYYDRSEDIFIKRVGDTYAPLFGEEKLYDYYVNKEINLIPIGEFLATKKQLKSNQKANEKQENSNFIANEKQELFRKLVGKKPLVIYPIANENQNNDIYELCKLIEQKTIKSLKLTNVHSTINKIYTNYLNALKYSNKEDLYKLGSCLEFLDTKIALQQNSNESRTKKEKNLIRKSKIRRILLSSAAVILLGVGLHFFIQSKKSNNAIEISENQTLIEKRADIENLIKIFCTQKDTALTEYRITYILQNIPLPENEDVVIEKINHFAIYGN